MPDQIKNGFKESRIAKGLNASDIATLYKINISVVRGWESGVILPPREILCKLAKHLDVSTDMLLLSEKRKPLIIDDLNSKDKESVRRLYKEIKWGVTLLWI